MSARSPKDRASRVRPAPAPGLDRRGFLCGLLVLLSGPRAVLAAAGRIEPSPLPSAVRRALATSPYVYVSPLRRDGSESTCHGEVWFGWLDDAVLLTTATRTWKARAVAQGLDRARIWVGDFGRWKRLLGRNEKFRDGPSFVARGRRLNDPELLERLFTLYGEKYPEEFGSWEDRMRRGHAAGERVLIRYEPLAEPPATTPPGAGSP